MSFRGFVSETSAVEEIFTHPTSQSNGDATFEQAGGEWTTTSHAPLALLFDCERCTPATTDDELANMLSSRIRSIAEGSVSHKKTSTSDLEDVVRTALIKEAVAAQRRRKADLVKNKVENLEEEGFIFIRFEPNDPKSPRDWPKARKYFSVFCSHLNVCLASQTLTCSTGREGIEKTFGLSAEFATVGLSMC